MLAKALTSTIKQFLFDPHASFVHSTIGTMDVAAWTSNASGKKRTLVLATNIESVDASASLDGLVGNGSIAIVLKSNGLAEVGSRTSRGREVRLGGFGTIGFIVE